MDGYHLVPVLAGWLRIEEQQLDTGSWEGWF
jgi:hypothetical protein